jgi:hypothetical protein
MLEQVKKKIYRPMHGLKYSSPFVNAVLVSVTPIILDGNTIAIKRVFWPP